MFMLCFEECNIFESPMSFHSVFSGFAKTWKKKVLMHLDGLDCFKLLDGFVLKAVYITFIIYKIL